MVTMMVDAMPVFMAYEHPNCYVWCEVYKDAWGLPANAEGSMSADESHWVTGLNGEGRQYTHEYDLQRMILLEATHWFQK